MKRIIITGSTRGIGRGLADSFLALGSAVVISGRRPESVEAAVAELSARHDTGRVLGQACDVTDFEQVQALWDTSHSEYGQIDVWINNAGSSHPQTDFCDHPAELIRAVVSTNLIGTM